MSKVNLGDLVHIKTGRLDANAAVENGKYPFFTTAREISRIDSYSYDDEVVLVAGNGDLNVKYYSGKFDAYQRTYILTKKEENLNLKYIYYFLESYLETLRYQAIGGVIKYIKLANLTEAKLNLPALPTQHHIAQTLDQATSLIEKRKAQIAELDKLVKAVFLEMFGDPILNPLKWDKLPLKTRCEISTGNTPPRSEESNYGNFIEWIKSDNILENSLHLTKAKEYLSETGEKIGKSVEPNSLIMTCIAGSIKSIGNVAIVDRKVAFNQQLNAITPQSDNVYYLYYLMKISKKQIENAVNLSLKGILSKNKLSDLEFIFPPLDLQTLFAQKVCKIEAEKDRLQRSLAEMENNLTALMGHFFG